MYVFHAPRSTQQLRDGRQFELLRHFVPSNVLYRAGGDIDAMYEAVAECTEEQPYSTTGSFAKLPEQMRDAIEAQAFEWNSLFTREIAEQAEPLGLEIRRDLSGGILTYGDRVLFLGPRDNLT